MGQQVPTWSRSAKDRDQLEDSGGELLPAVQGHGLNYKMICIYCVCVEGWGVYMYIHTDR